NPKVPAILNAPLLKQESPSKFPVIVFSHGMGGQRTTYTVVCLEMASRGYLVASIEHRDGSASATNVIRQEDDGKTSTVEWVPMIPKPEGDEFPVRNKQVHQRADEMGHMLDLLVSIDQGSNINNLCNTGMDLSQFKGKLDLDRVAAMGHSFGGATSLVSLYKDTRLKCAVVLDGWMLPVDREMYPQISQPVLFINTEAFHWPGNIARMNRLMGRDGVDRKMITIKGTVHQSQSDFTFLFGKFFGTRVQSRGALDPHVAIDINNEASLAFLAKHLDLPGNDYNSALLEGEGEHLIRGTNVKLDPRPAKKEQVDTSVEKPTPDEAKWHDTCMKHAFSFPRWRVYMDGKNEWVYVTITPRKTRHVRFGAYGKLRLYLTMFLCVLWDLSVFLSKFQLEDLLTILCTCPIPVCVFLKDLSPIYETREHQTLTVNADPETGLQQEEEPHFCRQGCVKEDGEE
ncbi:Platelet-activating factor acetylhydrolase, partial [Branchiostoma belcheri]